MVPVGSTQKETAEKEGTSRRMSLLLEEIFII